MPKYIRTVSGDNVQDPSIIEVIKYNKAAGSGKVSEVGRHLLPISIVSGGVLAYTTDATTARSLPPGTCLAVYNNANAVGSVTLGESSSVTSLAVGVTDASGHVGVPCAPNAWTYIACSIQTWVISSAATLLVYVIDDDSSVRVSSS